jgi:hypothetical protein
MIDGAVSKGLASLATTAISTIDTYNANDSECTLNKTLIFTNTVGGLVTGAIVGNIVPGVGVIPGVASGIVGGLIKGTKDAVIQQLQCRKENEERKQPPSPAMP